MSASSSSKIKKASASKRQRRDDDPNDEDYAPNQSDLAAESSAAEDSDESMEGAHGSDDDEVIDVQSMNLPGRRWTAESYAKSRSVNQFHQARDTPMLFFQTQVQQDVFFGHMLRKTVFSHQTIDLAYMNNQAVMIDLVARFESMGLTDFLQHRCDWNETIIRQFYATVEIDLDEENLWWMTRKRIYYATFAQFAAANQLNYEFLTDHESVNIDLNYEP